MGIDEAVDPVAFRCWVAFFGNAPSRADPHTKPGLSLQKAGDAVLGPASSTSSPPRTAAPAPPSPRAARSKRTNLTLRPGSTHHTDGGGQYASETYRCALKESVCETCTRHGNAAAVVHRGGPQRRADPLGARLPSTRRIRILTALSRRLGSVDLGGSVMGSLKSSGRTPDRARSLTRSSRRSLANVRLDVSASYWLEVVHLVPV